MQKYRLNLSNSIKIKFTMFFVNFNYFSFEIKCNVNPLGVINQNTLLMIFLMEICIQLEQKCLSELSLYCQRSIEDI